ncbi:Aste57867_17243 [Aphanomyces stellatus]|uniref:Aste57867_17243 protein n=1 Tax=Aphanomyces stellatus TaxID=120398 RepID=A0A485L905_9STRA|nr:hypothetical protein As57867_017184 [Aphanomyces stellatus]VFT93999.1 Aste57867_17243 [Aphanomyces stellatus]
MNSAPTARESTRSVRFFGTTPNSQSDDDDDLDEAQRLKHQRRRQWRFQSLPLVVFSILFLCVLIPFIWKHKKIDSLRYYRNDNGTIDILKNPNLIVSLSGMSTDPYEMTVTSVLTTIPPSVMSPDQSQIVQPFRIQVGTTVVVISDNTNFYKAPMVSKVPLLTGSLAWYPFDSYQMKLEIQTVTGASDYNGNKNRAISDLSFVVATPDDFSWTYTVQQTKSEFDTIIVGGGQKSNHDTGFTALTITVTRDFNIYMALVFVGIWSVTIAVGYIGSMAVIWKRRAPDNPVLFVSALFAVPTFRNTTPGKPPYGCLFDVLCTYFSIGVILSFLLLMAFAYMKPKPVVKPKAPSPQKKEDETMLPFVDATGPVVGGDKGGDVVGNNLHHRV